MYPTANLSHACVSDAHLECAPASCRHRCALEVIDELLSRPAGVTGEEMDGLLDLRWHLHRMENAEAVLRAFCDLRVRMERRHYLAFFRIRRWLENNLLAVVRTTAEPIVTHTVSVRLDYYCVEAVRRASLCRALGNQHFPVMPKLAFAFRPAAVEAMRGRNEKLALA